MISFMPEWVEWVFLITGMLAWLGACGTLIVLLCYDDLSD